MSNEIVDVILGTILDSINISEGRFTKINQPDDFVLSGHAQKYRVNFISLLMKSTFLPMNSKMSMSKPEERVLQPMDL